MEAAVAMAPGEGAPVDPRRLDAVKFASCLPDDAVERMLAARDRDEAGIATVQAEPVATT